MRIDTARVAMLALGAAIALQLAGCGTAPTPGTSRGFPAGRDGPPSDPPSDLDRVPDAEPRIEPIRPGGANKPYTIDGTRYTPITIDSPLKERGLASWYGRKFHGRRTANGEVYDMYAMTAAHPTMPLPSYVRVRNPANGREVIVRINDRGPFHASRVIDLSYTAALRLDLLRGVAPVELERITNDDIRSAAWRRPGDAASATAPLPAPAAQPLRTASASAEMAAVPPLPTTAPADDSTGAAESAARADTGVDTPARPATVPAPAPPSVTQASADSRPAASARGFWVQLGAFRQRDGAVDFQRRLIAELDWLAPLLAVFDDAPMHRLQAGPYASRDEAGVVADRLQGALQLVPLIVERR